VAGAIGHVAVPGAIEAVCRCGNVGLSRSSIRRRAISLRLVLKAGERKEYLIV
jgi:hypothetical protein